ncbi:DUF600 family protein [Listeria aquatica]|uniref:DUF600 family protein n=1 Tax=Listeria aquatica TaxID=1494960 RepID=A0A841ZR97_9LIST|nr:immunity protein YezG family protein [Listeria aquatica]MBC1521685.1 DUF600 family protein [Listeria aquatica]
MSFEGKLNRIYLDIAQKISDAIPVNWKEFYFQGEINDGEGGVFFFFNTTDNNEYKYCYDIPEIYNINRKEYDKKEDEIFDLTVKLQETFIENEQEPWFSVTMIVNEERKLKIHFDYINWSKSEFGPTARLKYFEYKYLNKEPLDGKEKDLFIKMSEYEKKQSS